MPTVRVGALAGRKSHNSHIVVHKPCHLPTTVVDRRVVLLENEQNPIALALEEQEVDAKHSTAVT